MVLEIDKMSMNEKLQAMELLWDDMCKNAPEFTSPDWHEAELKERELLVEEGKEKFLDWEKVKKDIKKSNP